VQRLFVLDDIKRPGALGAPVAPKQMMVRGENPAQNGGKLP